MNGIRSRWKSIGEVPGGSLVGSWDFPPSVIIGAQAQKPTKSGLITGGWSLEGMTKNEKNTLK